MAFEESLRSISLDADSSVGIYTGVPGLPGSANPNGGKQYHFVKITGAHTVGLATALADPIVGVMQNKPQMVGQAATVGIAGVSKVQLGGTVAAGDFLVPNAAGAGVMNAAGKCVALSGGATGDLVPVLLRFN